MQQRPRSRRVAVTSLRTTLTVVSMVAVYYLAPLKRGDDVRIGLWLLVGLAVLAAAVVWQVRAIVVSETPRLKAIETVAVGLPLLLLLFSVMYLLMSDGRPGSFTEPLDRTGALYFTVTVFATVGFGDITPLTDQARIVTMVQMVVGLVAVGIVARLLFTAVQQAVDRQAAGQEEDDRPQG